MTGRNVGCDQRTAWLLATSRLLHPGEFAQRDRFVAAVRDRGLAADSSRVSRWESGAAPVSREVIETYEEVLGVGAGTLIAVTEGQRRHLGADDADREPATVRRDVPDLDKLLDTCVEEAPTGADWQALAFELTRFEQIYLRQKEWASLCNRLVLELSRAVGMSYVRRYEAAATLVRHPSGQRHITRALGSFVMHPDTQVVAPVFNLLTEVSDAAASDLVLRMLASESKGLRRAAASVAAAKLRRGHFGDEALRALEAYASVHLRQGEPLEGSLDAFDLATQLPTRSFAAVMDTVSDRRVQAQLGRARSTGELLTRQQAAHVVADVGAAVQADTEGQDHPEPDQMLRRLVREALFHTHKARRHHAGLFLAASPYRHAVARQCHTLTGGSNYFLAARAWTLMMRVGIAGRRGDVVLRALTDTRPTLKSRALINLGLNHEPVSSAEARALLAQLEPDSRGSVRYGTFFALGMSGAKEMKALVNHEQEKVRRAAQWWLDQGSAIHDPVRQL